MGCVGERHRAGTAQGEDAFAEREARRQAWYLHTGDAAGVPRLRREIMTYLAEHAMPGSDLTGTEVVISELLGNAVAHTPGPAWVHVEWDGEHPRLRVCDVGEGFCPVAVNGTAEHMNGTGHQNGTDSLQPELPPDPLSDTGRGLYLVSQLARELAVSRQRHGGTVVAAVLDVSRG